MTCTMRSAPVLMLCLPAVEGGTMLALGGATMGVGFVAMTVTRVVIDHNKASCCGSDVPARLKALARVALPGLSSTSMFLN